MHHIRQRRKLSGKDSMAALRQWSSTTAWRRVKEVIDAAKIADGPHKCAKGWRHGYGVHTVRSGVPLNMLRKWFGAPGH